MQLELTLLRIVDEDGIRLHVLRSGSAEKTNISLCGRGGGRVIRKVAAVLVELHEINKVQLRATHRVTQDMYPPAP